MLLYYLIGIFSQRQAKVEMVKIKNPDISYWAELNLRATFGSKIFLLNSCHELWTVFVQFFDIWWLAFHMVDDFKHIFNIISWGLYILNPLFKPKNVCLMGFFL